jgi:preprotein translocase subunit YajC
MWDAVGIFAEGEAAGSGSGFSSFFLLLPIVILAYLLIVDLPRRRRQDKERQALTSNLKKGEEVLTIAGIYGTVVTVSDTKDEIVIKVDDGTRLRMTKTSILRNISREEETARVQKEQKEKK